MLAVAQLCFPAAASGNENAYSVGARTDFPDQLLWGDLHVHSATSLDAYAFGNEGLGVEETLRFARGETIRSTSGLEARLRRPLDFLLVADHAEYLGIFHALKTKDPAALSTDLGQRWARYLEADDIQSIMTEYVAIVQRDIPVEQLSKKFRYSAWEKHNAASEKFNEPGRFTVLLGYEWTSMFNGGNLHRVAVFADGPEKVNQAPPFSALDSLDPEDLWQSLETYEQRTGGQALAIPHNANLSNGLLFAKTRFDGRPIDRSYAASRARWEPLYEVTQMKGDAEAHPKLSPEDEFADFETWSDDGIARDPKEDWMLPFEYARSALKIGLQMEVSLGANPFKFGLVGGTDAHTGLATADDNNFFGKFPGSEPGSARLTSKMGGFLWENWKLAASGYTAVWARENSRAAIFSALKRREVYATTGPRISLRVYGGWDYEPGDEWHPNVAELGYAKGVPMGGDLFRDRDGRAVGLLIAASKDPDGANLDRLQVIKGWLDENGQLSERVYNVALSDGRVVDEKTGRAPAVGSTVDLSGPTYSNRIGDPMLAKVWIDPDFDAEQKAFYYVRVLEIPTPRWTAYDVHFFGGKPDPATPMVNQERAYSSPIWYSP